MLDIKAGWITMLNKIRRLNSRETDKKDPERSILEEKRVFDIAKKIKIYNIKRTIEIFFRVLYDWLKKDMFLVQKTKDREERTLIKTKTTISKTTQLWIFLYAPSTTSYIERKLFQGDNVQYIGE